MRNKIDNIDIVESRLSEYWNDNEETLCGYASARLLGQKLSMKH